MSVTLRGMTWEHARGFDCMVGAAMAYRAEMPDVRVEWEYRSLQAFADAPVDELAQSFDLLVIDHPHIPLAVAQGCLAPLDGAGFDDQLQLLADQSVGASHASYAYDGHQYGLASDAAAQVAVHRPDLLSDVPQSWEEVLQLARDGRVLWAAKPIDAFSSLLTIAANNGTPPFSEPGSFLDAESAMAVLARMRELASLVPEFCLEANPIDIAEALSREDRWLYSPLAFGYSNYSRMAYRRVRLAYTDIPSGSRGTSGSVLGGAGIAVSAHSAHLGQAQAFAVWVASSDAQCGVYFDAGGQPGNAQAWDDDGLNAQTLDFFRNTRATLEGALVRPREVGFIAFQDTVSPWVTEMLRGRISEDLLVSRMNDEAERMAGDH